jgi:formylglycine-generating enzyme required for sulfatase activity
MNIDKVTGQVIGEQIIKGNQTNIYGAQIPPVPEDDELLRPYREHLIEQCRFVPLRGIHRDERRERGDPQRPADDPDQRLELERIFVDLDTTRRVEIEKGVARKAKTARQPALKSELQEGGRETRALPALEAVASGAARHVVLHGAPGCGKSTFVRFLVLALAQCGLGRAEAWLKRLPTWPPDEASLLPVRIELRHFAVWLNEQNLNASEPCHLWNHFNQSLAQLRDKKSWRDLLPATERMARAGRAIFFLDGLDEVPGGKGKLFVRDCIEKFADEGIGHACRIVVTCRTRSYDARYKEPDQDRTLHLFERPASAAQARMVGDSSPAFELAPFDDPKKRRFIAAWYEALKELGEITADATRLRTEALEAAACDTRNEKLAKLAENPLLLTVIAHLHSSQRDLKLPDNRAELFSDLIDLLLTRWAERHQVRTGAASDARASETLAELLQDPAVRGFELEHLLQLVAELAHDHYRGGSGQTLCLIPESTLRKRLAAEHRHANTEEGAAWAERVMNFIQFRAGLLNSPDGGDHFDFPHSLLGEYLAAYHLTRQRQSSVEVAKKVTPDGNWDEVVRLAAGHHVFVRKETRDALDLVEELCAPAKGKADTGVTELEWRRVALAGDIIHEIGPERLERGDVRRQGPECLELVRGLLQRLLGRGALPPRDRARAGLVLGHLGDQRPGVQLTDGLLDPDDFIELPAGKFILGETNKEAVIKHSYRLSRFPVTVAQYEPFKAEGYDEKNPTAPNWWGEEGWSWKVDNKITGPNDYWPVFQTPNHPRVGVSWYEAMAFCRWLTELLRLSLQSSSRREEALTSRANDALLPRLLPGQEIRLPTEAQWEWAARWNRKTGQVDNRYFPWGGRKDDADLAQHCNMYKTGIRNTSAVGLFHNGKADCGAMDLSGNVWEWCENWYDEMVKQYRVLRGGSWDGGGPESLSCSCRDYGAPGIRFLDLGFRCVVVLGDSAPR